MTPDPNVRASELVAAVRAHKSEIRRHRFELSRAKAALDALHEECAARGIRLTVYGEETKKGISWPSNPSSTSTP
jgi:ribosomal protein S12